MEMSENIAMELLYKEIQKWERQSKRSTFNIKAGKKPTPKPVNPIVSGIESLEIQKYDCCKREAKIKPIIKLSGSYCPFCGVNYDGDK